MRKTYVRRKVMIEFANPKVKAKDEINYITLACMHTRENLKSQYGVRLGQPFVTDSGFVMVNVWIPQKLDESGFSCGNHLKGISQYLLKYCGEKYVKYRAGNRLLNYVTVDLNSDIALSDDNKNKVNLISDFVNFIERATAEEVENVKNVLEDYIYEKN